MRWTLLVAMVMTLPLLARPRILVVTATAGFRHDSIEIAEQVLSGIAAQQNVEIEFARNEDELRKQAGFHGLSAVFFVNTTGELPAEARDSLLAWINRGGTFVGIHSATDTWHASPEYLEMIGAEFATHPPDAEATIVVEDATHPATKNLPSPHVMVEEIYEFVKFDRAGVRLLLSTAGAPLAWEKTHGNGEVLYTALGHREDVWQSAWFRAHVTGIMEWALAQRHAPSRRRAVR
ncbi:MAG TPA: ThuA domain-containing protein [Thermoanaerobaculia bacterium]